MKMMRILRELLGISQQTMSEESGMSRQSLSTFENGRAFPSRAVAQHLDNTIERILDQRALAAIEDLRVRRASAENPPPAPAERHMGEPEPAADSKEGE